MAELSVARQRRKGLAIAAIAMISGLVLIYVANNILSVDTLGQAFAGYVGVFVVVAGILYGASTLFISD